MNYKEMKKQIIASVGGQDNIVNVTHCATRLRLVLKDTDKFDEDSIKKIDGVVNTLKMGGQCQIIIGHQVKELYNEFSNDTFATYEAKGKQFNIKDTFTAIGEFMSAAIGPAIVPIIGGGLIKSVLVILTQLNLLSSTSDIYTVFWFAADAVFQFLPIFIAIGVSRKLNSNMMLAIYSVCILISPTFVNAVNSGTVYTIFGIQIPALSYYNAFLPALLTSILACLIEKGLKKVLPDVLQSLLIPFIVVLVMTPLGLLVTGPLSNTIANWLSIPLIQLAQYSQIFIPVLGAIMPFMVMFGLHGPLFTFSMVAFYMTVGYEPLLMPASLCSHLAMGAVALAVSIKSKNQKVKSNAASCCATVWLGAVSEPVIFGVLLQNKISMLAACIGGFAGSLIAGIGGLKCYAVAGSGLFFIPTFIGAESSLILALAASITSIVVAFIVTMMKYRDEDEMDIRGN